MVDSIGWSWSVWLDCLLDFVDQRARGLEPNKVVGYVTRRFVLGRGPPFDDYLFVVADVLAQRTNIVWWYRIELDTKNSHGIRL